MDSMISTEVKTEINDVTLNWMERSMHFPSKLHNKDGTCRKDEISDLPSEILVKILSHLTVRGAARTSILSRRWKHLWKFITSLNFDKVRTINNVHCTNQKSLETERKWYICLVNEALDAHQVPCIEDFGVRFDLGTSCSGHIDEWVRFALRKRVNRLELDLGWMSIFDDSERYMFTPERFTGSSFNSLTSLQFCCVEVTGDVLEYLLYNCPFLERLSVDCSHSLVKFKISGPSDFRLKHLEIIYCYPVKEIDISAANLTSFTYCGRYIQFPFKNGMLPFEACIGGTFGLYLINPRSTPSSCFSQVVMLTLDFHLELAMIFTSFPKLTKLKQLELRLAVGREENLQSCTTVVQACPFLVKLTLKIYGRGLIPTERKIKKFSKCPFQRLEVLEFVGFEGTVGDVELTMFLVENAISLKKITLDSCHPISKGTDNEFVDTEKRRAARIRAELLREEFPSKCRAQVVIL